MADYEDRLCKVVSELNKILENNFLDQPILNSRNRRFFLNRQIKLLKLRDLYLPRDKFSEVCWAILIEMEMAWMNGLRYSVSDVGRDFGLPQTTILRGIHLLEEADLLMRTQDPEDKRRTFISITEAGSALIDKIINGMSEDIRRETNDLSHARFARSQRSAA